MLQVSWLALQGELVLQTNTSQETEANVCTSCRNTDDVRLATSQQFGQLIQQLTTCIACLVVAFISSWSLTLVILASVPITAILTTITMTLGRPYMLAEFAAIEKASGQVERTVNSIPTIKAFNAVPEELSRFREILHQSGGAYMRYCVCWASRLGLTSTLMLAMFVQGFWYGSHLVQKGSITPGAVMTVFWAALMASTQFQQLMTGLTVIEKGKVALSNIEKVLKDADTPSSPKGGTFPTVSLAIGQIPQSPTSPESKLTHSSSIFAEKQLRRPEGQVISMRKIKPQGTCRGEISLRHVSFAYPSRPDQLVLKDVSMYFPAHETTYVVGGSGSGKSTIAQLLLRLYTADRGAVEVDSHDIAFLDSDWCKQHIAAVSQSPVLFDMSVRENVAIGLVGRGGAAVWQAANVSMEQIIAACRIALLHDFVRDLPDGYETRLGVAGANLSGGQKQRLALARAVLRDPPVLILDEATSALDMSARGLVHEAVKRWRRGKTTIIITHDLSQVSASDFIYVMKEGSVVQQGYRGDLVQAEGSIKQLLEDLQQDVEKEDAKSMSPLASPTGLEHAARKSLKAVARRGSEEAPIFAQAVLPPVPSIGSSALDPRKRRSAEAGGLLDLAGLAASSRRPKNIRTLRRLPSGDAQRADFLDGEKVPPSPQPDAARKPAAVFPTIRLALHLVPNKLLLVLGFLISTAAGGVNPAFSIILGKLIATMGTTVEQSQVVTLSVIVIALAIAEGLCIFSRYFVLELAADRWIQSMRTTAYRNVLLQHKSWFDVPEHTAQRICQSIAKDGEDARRLVGQCLGNLWSSFVLICTGLILALVFGWQLTLVGLGFAFLMLTSLAVQTQLLNRFESINKQKRDTVSKRFYNLAANIRGIRAMALESVLVDDFEDSRKEAYRSAVRVAPLSGIGTGLGEGITYLAEAGMYSLGAFLLIKGTYDLQRALITLNLIIFACTFSATSVAFLPNLTKAIQAIAVLNQLLELKTEGPESKGEGRYLISGNISFRGVRFAYPSRPQDDILRDVSFQVRQGERIAIVGGSGCGKSTVAALLQRLYEPNGGKVLMDGRPLSSFDCTYLREHLTVVSQNPSLFDATVAENIAYGGNRGRRAAEEGKKEYNDTSISSHTFTTASRADVQEAARAANVDEFIGQLQSGYETNLGSNASLVSGGQAQRLAIARALVRHRARVLILDECTSALDMQNQVTIMQTLLGREHGEMRKGGGKELTTVVITHKKEIMQLCDRIIVLKNGTVAQQGTYEQLISQRGGAFAELASGGEWGA